MKQYIDIVKHVLDNGQVKQPTRRNPITYKHEPVDGGVKTIACANVLFSHEMQDGFPLLTTKKMPWRSIRVELEGFIRGITSKKWYKDRKCNFWDQWANPKIIADKKTDDNTWEEIKQLQLEEDDLGPIYGAQWRRFNEAYDEDDDGWTDTSLEKAADQFKSIVTTLRENPYDRRMVCSGWNPLQINRMALPPCHWGWNVCVIGNKINLFWVQRSCDLMLGVPCNIASYALLLELLAADCGFRPGNLSGMLVDCHIYENQIEGAKEQITRTPKELPFLMVSNKSGQLRKKFSIFDWTYKDIILDGYTPFDRIDFGKVVV